MLRPRLARLVTALAVLGATVAPASARAQSADAKAEVMVVIKRMFDGMRASDSALVHGTFHPQLRMVTVGKGREGTLRVSVEESPEGFLKAIGTPRPAKLDERIWGERVEIDGALASVWVDYNLYVGDKFMHCGIDHFLLVRGDDAAWKIISLADTRRTEGCKP